MRHIEFSCDWCGLRASGGVVAAGTGLPEGWDTIDVVCSVEDEEICEVCLKHARESVDKVRAERLRMRGVHG